MEITKTKSIKLNIYLVRHAETDYNRLGLIQGQLDTKLSINGLKQAKCLGNHLKEVNFRYIFTSNLERAYKTADEIFNLNINKNKIKHVIIDELLRERRFGEAEGKHKTFLSEQAQKLNIPTQNYVPEGAETNEDLIHRWKLFLEKLCKKIIFDYFQSDLKLENLCSKNENQNDILKTEFINNQKSIKTNAYNINLSLNNNGNTNETHQLDDHVLVVTHGAMMKRMVKFLIKETNCVYESEHLDYIDKSIPNTSITNFEIKIDIDDTSVIQNLFSDTKNEFHFLKYLKVKCNYINNSSHFGFD